MNVVNLNALAVKRHVVEYDNVKHYVRTMTQRIINVIDAADRCVESSEKLAGYHDAIALVLPSMKRLDIESLEIPMMQAIFELSRDQINVIEEAAASPNADSPTPKKESRRRATTASAGS